LKLHLVICPWETLWSHF